MVRRKPAGQRHGSEPKYTYSRGIFIESEIGKKKIDLSLVHDNAEVGTFNFVPANAGYLSLQGLLLRAELEDFAFTRIGARLFLKELGETKP